MLNRTYKICFLADTHGLYDDRIYWKEAVSLKNNGFEVHYILASEIDESGITKEGISYEKIKRKIYLNNRIFNFLIKKLMPHGLYSNMFKAAKKFSADVYHIHDLKVSKLAGKLKRIKNQPKIIYDIHEPHPENIIDYNSTSGILSILKRIYAKYIWRREIRIANKCDFVITTEENLCERFRSYIPNDKVDIIYNYTNLEYEKTTSGYIEKKYDAIYCGGITRLRGAFQILEAVKIAVNEIPEFRMLFLGSYFPGKLKEEMKWFVEKNKLSKNVVLMDFVPYAKVGDYYRQSKIGLGIFMPIATHKIILQIKIFEYMNYGLPIIGSNFGHIQNYINDDDVGITVNPCNAEEIANALIKLLSDDNLYGKLSENGISAVREKYKWPHMEKKLIGIYTDLLKY